MQFDFPATPTVGQRYEANGVAYVWSGVAWMGEGGTTPLATKVRVSVYPTAGTFPYVPPADLKALQVELFGPGGGGGGAGATAAGQYSAGGGGGGGGYSRKIYNRADLGAAETLVVGVGGTGGVYGGANATAGTPTTFKGQSAGGGGLATNGAPGTTFSGTSRGAPGVGSGGDFNGNGNSGAYGFRFIYGQPFSQQGFGGAGYGKAQYFATVISTSGVGADGSVGVGGNGGAVGAPSLGAANGGAGGDGYAILTEYLYDADEIELPQLQMKTTVIEGNAGPGADVTGNYIPPDGLKFLQVELWAGGGAGGGVSALAGAKGGGVGGSAGAYSRKLYKRSDLNASEPYVVGRGGNTPSGVGGDGGASTFKGMTAGAGTGGGITTPNTSDGIATRIGGGVATGGDFNAPGGHGMTAMWLTSGVIKSGDGGMAPGGSSVGGRGNGSAGAPSTGSAGNAPGGGGAGGAVANGAAVTGGTGAGGRIVFTEYFVDLPTVNDDIEIWGDWTPVFQFGGNNVGMAQAGNKGRSRKRGKLVTLWFDILLTAKGTSTGAAAIVAIPYPAAASPLLQAGTIGYTTGMGAGQANMGCYLNMASGGYIQITAPNGTGATATALNTATDGNFTNASRIIGKIEYEAAS